MVVELVYIDGLSGGTLPRFWYGEGVLGREFGPTGACRTAIWLLENGGGVGGRGGATLVVPNNTGSSLLKGGQGGNGACVYPLTVPI